MSIGIIRQFRKVEDIQFKETRFILKLKCFRKSKVVWQEYF